MYMLMQKPPKTLSWGKLRALQWEGAPSGHTAPVTVFLHGIGDGADIWRPVLSEWPRALQTNALAFDLPGHGGSQWLSEDKYDVVNLANIVAKSLKEQSIKNPILVGHSLGARVALTMAAESMCHPTLMVLVDMPPDPVPNLTHEVETHLELWLDSKSSHQSLVQAISTRLPFADKKVIEKVVPAMISAGIEAHGTKRTRIDPNIKTMLRCREAFDEWETLKTLNTPVGFIRGGFSSALDRRTAIRMANTVPKSLGVETVPQAGHAIAFEKPAALADALERLTRHGLQSS